MAVTKGSKMQDPIESNKSEVRYEVHSDAAVAGVSMAMIAVALVGMVLAL